MYSICCYGFSSCNYDGYYFPGDSSVAHIRPAAAKEVFLLCLRTIFGYTFRVITHRTGVRYTPTTWKQWASHQSCNLGNCKSLTLLFHRHILIAIETPKGIAVILVSFAYYRFALNRKRTFQKEWWKYNLFNIHLIERTACQKWDRLLVIISIITVKWVLVTSRFS